MNFPGHLQLHAAWTNVRAHLHLDTAHAVASPMTHNLRGRHYRPYFIRYHIDGGLRLEVTIFSCATLRINDLVLLHEGLYRIRCVPELMSGSRTIWHADLSLRHDAGHHTCQN